VHWELAMHADTAELTDVQKGLSEAVLNLREQQDLVAELDCPQYHQALLRLLSNGLRVYCWFEDLDRSRREETDPLPLDER
jgi:hypothetical protein